MFDRKILKSRAKFVLTRTLLASIIACAIVNLITECGFMYALPNIKNIKFYMLSDAQLIEYGKIFGIVSIVAVVIYIFAIAPLKVGLKHFMLKSADLDANTENLVYPFKRNYKNVLWVTFVKNLYVGLWSLLGLIPVFVGVWKFNLKETVFNLLKVISEEKSILASMGLGSLISAMLLITVLFLVPAIIKGLQYSMVDYILAENPDTKRSVAIGRSKDMMVGYKWEYVKLAFSFLGWYVVASSFCCGFGLLILNPYIEATYAQMYLEISGQGKDYSMYNFVNPFGGGFDGGFGSGFGGFGGRFGNM